MSSVPVPRSAPRLVDPWAAAIGGVVVVLGVAMVFKPIVVIGALGLAAFACVVAVPAWLLVVLFVAVTAIVPYGVQNQFGIGAGTGSPGLILSDVLLAASVIRVAPSVLRDTHSTRARAVLLLIGAFLVVCGFQLVRGLAAGRSPSDVGAEFRTMIGFAAVFPAYAVLSGELRESRRLLRGLAVAGLLLGLWGIAQWALNIEFGGAGDAGVREGVRLTTAGKGQVQGGLFAFPVAIVMGVSALVSSALSTFRAKVFVTAVVVLNAISLVLTFERTFWVATVIGAGLVVLMAGRAQRLRAAIWGVLLLMVFFAGLATFLPDELTAARERLMSLSQYRSDSSVHYRVAESRHVTEQIREAPLHGSGFGASIFWGRPWDQVPPQAYTYSHNGYLWVIWKVGIPGALCLYLAVGLSLLRRGSPANDALDVALLNGTQAALIGLLLISVTFPSFSQLSITPLIGALLAIRVARYAEGEPAAISR